MPEWNLVAERQNLIAKLTSLALICAMTGSVVSLVGCSKLRVPGFQDYESTEFGGFNQPPTTPSVTAQPQVASETISEADRLQEVIDRSEAERESKLAKARLEAEAQQAEAKQAEASMVGEVPVSKVPVGEVPSLPMNNQIVNHNPLKGVETVPSSLRKIQAVQDASVRVDSNNLDDSSVRAMSFDSALQSKFDAPESPIQYAAEVATTEVPVAEDEINKDVTLVARVGDSRVAPENMIRNGGSNVSQRPDSMPQGSQFSNVRLVKQDSPVPAGGGMLRPQNSRPTTIEAIPPSENADSFARMKDQISENRVSAQPLRPMLFDAQTRQLNAQYDKTLREPAIRQELERELAVHTKTPATSEASIVGLADVESPAIEGTFESAAPIRPFEKRPFEKRPFEKQNDWQNSSTTEFVAANKNRHAVDRLASASPMISRPNSTLQEVPPFAAPPKMDTNNALAFVELPVVDQQAFATKAASASFVVPQPTIVPGVVIPGAVANVREIPAEIVPAEVIEDADRLAEAAYDELETFAESDNNEFPVITAGNVEHDRGCAFCENNPEPGCPDCPSCGEGRPLTGNNDFAVSAVPTATDISPMVIPPSSVPGPPESHNTTSDFEVSGSELPVPSSTPYDANSIASTGARVPVSPASLTVDNGLAPNYRASDIPPVGVDALVALNTVTWQTRLDQAIDLVEDQIETEQPGSESQSGLEINLRLLQVLRRQMDNVARSETHLTSNEQQFWTHQLDAITTMLNSNGEGSMEVTDLLRHQSAHQTLEHLRQAVERLESIANLKIASGQLCTEISGFGQYKVFPSNEFSSGQRMLVYCEVENYHAMEQASISGPAFRTKLRGSFAIYDEQGKAVQQAEFPIVEDVARKKRRDFYMYMPVTLGELGTGNYRMHVLVEDINGNKTATLESPIDFVIR